MPHFGALLFCLFSSKLSPLSLRSLTFNLMFSVFLLSCSCHFTAFQPWRMERFFPLAGSRQGGRLALHIKHSLAYPSPRRAVPQPNPGHHHYHQHRFKAHLGDPFPGLDSTGVAVRVCSTSTSGWFTSTIITNQSSSAIDRTVDEQRANVLNGASNRLTDPQILRANIKY